MTSMDFKPTFTFKPTFAVPLGSKAHQLAWKFREQHKYDKKKKQVYLNTLAVYAVNLYCKLMGIKTDLKSSDSFDFLNQALMEIADLNLIYLVKVGCCPISPEDESFSISDIEENRLGYLIVEINEINERAGKATLLGYLRHKRKMKKDDLSVEELPSFDDFSDHIYQIRYANDFKKSQKFQKFLKEENSSCKYPINQALLAWLASDEPDCLYFLAELQEMLEQEDEKEWNEKAPKIMLSYFKEIQERQQEEQDEEEQDEEVTNQIKPKEEQDEEEQDEEVTNQIKPKEEQDKEEQNNKAKNKISKIEINKALMRSKGRNSGTEEEEFEEIAIQVMCLLNKYLNEISEENIYSETSMNED